MVDLHDFPHEKNTDVRDLFHTCPYLFWHWFLMRFCIDFDIIYAPFWDNYWCFFPDWFPVIFRRFSLQIVDQKVLSKMWDGTSFWFTFPTLFPRGCFGRSLGYLLPSFWSFWASFWFPFGSPLASFWANLGRLRQNFRCWSHCLTGFGYGMQLAWVWYQQPTLNAFCIGRRGTSPVRSHAFPCVTKPLIS